MAQLSPRSEPVEAERAGLPAVVPEPRDDTESWLTRVLRILFGWKAASTRAELEQALTDETQVSPAEAVMLKNILGLHKTKISRIMVPRADIVAVQQDIPLGELVKVFEGAAHSRLVVYNDTLDDPVGMVHIRDLIGFMTAHATTERAASGDEAVDGAAPVALNFANVDLALPLSAAKIARDMLYVPPSMPALDLLAKMQATRIHLALIIDEHGGSDGLVSIEDLVELIVGDIADEHDEDEGPLVTRQADGSFVANGRASLEEVREAIGEEFDVGDVAEEVDTLGGYLVTRAGHVPVRGELVPGPEPFEAEVLDADPRRVKRAKIYLRKNRRGPPRDATGAAKPAPARPATREEPQRQNTAPTP